MRALQILVTTVVCILFLTACGQKGPLYFPDQKATPSSVAPTK